MSFLRESGLRFDESLPYGEDQVFQFQLYPRCPHTILIPDRLVQYRISRPGSFMDSRLSNPERMAADHVAIVGRVIDDWREIGILDDFACEALDWVAEFSMIRIFQLDESETLKLLDPLKDILTRCFDEHLLRQYAETGIAGDFIKAVVYERHLATGNARRKAVHRYLAATRGRRFVAKMLINRVVWDGPWGQPIASVKERLCASETARKKAQWDEWEKQDERLRLDALRYLKSCSECDPHAVP